MTERVARRRGVFTIFALIAATCAATVALAGSASAGTGSQLYDLTCQGVVVGQNTGPTPTAVRVTSTSIAPDPAFPTGTSVAVTGDVEVIVSGALQAGVLAALGAGDGSVALSAGSSIAVAATNTTTPAVDIDISGPSVPWGGRTLGDLTLTLGSANVTSAAPVFAATDVGAAIAVSGATLPGALPPTARIATFLDPSNVVLTEAALADGVAGGALAFDVPVVRAGVGLGTFDTAGLPGDVMEFSPVTTPATAINLSLGGPAATFNQTNDDLVNPVGCNYLPAGVSVIPGADYLPFGSAALVDGAPIINGGNDITATVAEASSVPTSDIPVSGVDDQGITSWAIAPVSASGSATLTNVGPGDTTTIQYSPPLSFTGTDVFEISASDGVNTSVQTVTINVVGGDSQGQGVVQNVVAGGLDLLACGSADPDPTACSITMSPATLDGTTQTTTGSVNQITVIDGRGIDVGWSLSAQLAGPLANDNPSLTGPNAELAASNLRLLNQTCGVVEGGPTAPTPGGEGTLDSPVAICTAALGSNAGTFTADADLELTIPATVYAGSYRGSINIIVS